MLRFTSKCSLLLLAVMPRWAYADLECDGDGSLIDKSECRVGDVNRVFDMIYSAPTGFDVKLDKCMDWHFQDAHTQKGKGTFNFVSDRRRTVC